MNTVWQKGVIFLALIAILSGCPSPMVIREGKKIPIEVAVRTEFTEAENAYAAGHINLALEKYKKFVIDFPESSLSDDALFQIGKIYLQRGENIEALRQFDRLAREFPQSDWVKEAEFNRGICWLNLENFESANQILRGLVNKFSDSQKRAQIYYLIGETYYRTGNNFESLDWYWQAWRNFKNKQLKELTREQSKEIIFTKLNMEELKLAIKSFSGEFPSEYSRIRLAQKYFAQGNLAQAEAELKVFISKYRTHELAQEAQELLEKIYNQSVVKKDVLGCILPLSGKYRIYGQKALWGIELAVGAFKAENRDLDIKIIVKDSRDIPQLAVKAVEDLIFQDNAIGILGPLLSVTAEAAAYRAQELRVPLVTLSQKEGLPEIGDYIFRVSLTNSLQAKTLVDYVTQYLGLYRFAILYPKDPYGEELMNYFWDEVSEEEGEIIAIEAYNPKQTDFGEEIRKLVGLYYLDLRQEEKREWDESEEEGEWKPEPIIDFDAVFIPDYYDKVGLIVPQLAYYDVEEVQLLGSNGWNYSQLIEMAGRYVEGAIFVDGYFKDSPNREIRKFVRRFSATFSEEPDILAAQAYDAARMMFSVLKQRGVSSRSALREELLNLSKYQGITGNISFTDSGELEKELFILKIKDGRIVQDNP
ncbi:MAG: penicillin-binding protein activator [Deltaproteobacteria bacterium]|nr:MAG: penicillin-binding protein activator [Deltaproteobacteria bacterium]